MRLKFGQIQRTPEASDFKNYWKILILRPFLDLKSKESKITKKFKNSHSSLSQNLLVLIKTSCIFLGKPKGFVGDIGYFMIVPVGESPQIV